MSQAFLNLKNVRLGCLVLFALSATFGLWSLYHSALLPDFFEGWIKSCIVVVAIATLGFLLPPALTWRVGIFALGCGMLGAVIGGILDSSEQDLQEKILHISKYSLMGEFALVGGAIGTVWALLNLVAFLILTRTNRPTTIWRVLWFVLKQGAIFLSASLTVVVALAELSPKFHSGAAAVFDRLFASMAQWWS